MRDEALRTIGALKVLVNSLSGIPGRKAVLYVSDGIPVTPARSSSRSVNEICGGATRPRSPPASCRSSRFGSRPDGATSETADIRPPQAPLDAQKYSLASRFEDLAAHANANRVTFYTLQASGLRDSPRPRRTSDPGERVLQLMTVQQVQTANLQELARAMAADTGGRAILNANDFLPDLGRMREDFSRATTRWATRPPTRATAGEHRIEVKVEAAGPQGALPPELPRQAAGGEDRGPHARGALPRHRGQPAGDRHGDRRSGAGSEGGPWSVPVRLRIPLFRLTILNQQGAYQGKLRLLVVTGDDAGRHLAAPAGGGADPDPRARRC